jgi:hypothetical protein
MKTLFESQSCSRCGGSGKHSYCQMHGDMCFKCSGKGVVLTKRGSAAQSFYVSLCSKRISQLTPGDFVRFKGSKKMVKVLEVRLNDADGGGVIVKGAIVPWRFTIETTACGYATMTDDLVIVAQSPEQREFKQHQALLYQESLTKSGTVKKKRRCPLTKRKMVEIIREHGFVCREMCRGKAGVAVVDSFTQDGNEVKQWKRIKSEFEMWEFLGYGEADEARRVLHYGA